ncbi:MAG TPA: cysteine desulfurase [Firmicutes bacterium]|jgi:L-cysteine/cystine lyase|nr:cysteine desulfurase [Bacillota bacterium]
MSLERKVDFAKVRGALKLLQKFVYMNVGSVGPLPEETFEAMKQEQEEEFLNGRVGTDALQRKRTIKAKVRLAVADLIHATAEEIVLTQNTTEGINLVISGINWHPDDEVITTNVEHGAVLLPLFLIAKRYGVHFRMAAAETNLVQSLREQMTEKTKLIVLSHVSYSTGAILPLSEVISLAHRRGIPVLVDGAQSVGAIPVDVRKLGADYYSLPGQKWLLGPEGTGALFIRNDHMEELWQTFIGYSSVEQFFPGGEYVCHAGAQRFEVSSINLPKLAGQKASLEWLSDQVGWQWIFQYSNRLAESAREELAKIKGVTVITPLKSAGLISFRVPGVEPSRVVETLAKQGIIIRAIKELSVCRASIAFYNTEEELERLIKAIAILS